MSYVCRSAPEPQYTILREPVKGELPEFLIMEVQLPGIVRLSSDSYSLRIGALELILQLIKMRPGNEVPPLSFSSCMFSLLVL